MDEKEEYEEATILDLNWDIMINILSRCSARDVINFSLTCKEFSCYSDDGWLWRALLSRDFGDCDGMKGYDVLRKQEVELFLSNSQTVDSEDAPWRDYYKNNFQLSNNINFSPIWRGGYRWKGMEARQCHACARLGDYLIVVKGFTRDPGVYALDTKLMLEGKGEDECIFRCCDVIDDEEEEEEESEESEDEEIDFGDEEDLVVQVMELEEELEADMEAEEKEEKGDATEEGKGEEQGEEQKEEKGEGKVEENEEGKENEKGGEKEEKKTRKRKRRGFGWGMKRGRREEGDEKGPQGMLYGHSAVAIDDEMGNDSLGDLCYLDLGTWEWHVVYPDPALSPCARYGCSLTACGRKLYLIGGADGGSCQYGGADFNDTYIFCTEKMEWVNSQIADYNHPALGRRHAAVLVGKGIFCIGGGLPHTNTIAYFNTETQTWTPLTPSSSSHSPPTPRVSLSAHLANNAIFVMGGCEETGRLSRELFVLFPSPSLVRKQLEEPEKREKEMTMWEMYRRAQLLSFFASFAEEEEE